MSDHLPECPTEWFCLCSNLRAYHERLKDEADARGEDCHCDECTPTYDWTPPARESFNPDWLGTPDWEADQARNQRVAEAIELAIARSYTQAEPAAKQPWYKRWWTR